MPLVSQHPRISAYFGRAVGHRGHSGSDRDALVCEMFALLEQLEAEDKGLLGSISDKLGDPPEFADSHEQQVLVMVIKSVLGDDQRALRGRIRSLGDADFARSDDDPAIIIDREERRGILGAALGQAIGELTEQQQALVVNVYWKGLSQAGVARSQSRSRQRVHDDLNAIIRILADKMGHLRDLHVSS